MNKKVNFWVALKMGSLHNKEIKQELNQAVKRAIQWDEEKKLYTNRSPYKKHYRTTPNNVKLKLILRIFAMVEKRELYVDRHKISA